MTSEKKKIVEETNKQKYSEVEAHGVGVNLCQLCSWQDYYPEYIKNAKKNQKQSLNIPFKRLYMKYILNERKRRKLLKNISEKCLSAPVIWEVHIKALLRFPLIPVRRAKRKKKHNKQEKWETVKKNSTFIHSWWVY